ncbi:hypothetical protein CYMTET_28886 [Cymbomonas tetramitiformis]|uniref:F-box domain-containing protein n=1 Tax=Cymbomonas tetramitiformis TaxID=36881 RepID=A0AAE0KVG4_9CHLO|nr:hypothetical protein CYMTET_28886 [Cymbomonas tetramitiformis]
MHETPASRPSLAYAQPNPASPTKRGDGDDSESKALSLLDLPEELLTRTYALCGATGVGMCSQVCVQLRNLAWSSNTLWQRFATERFIIPEVVESHNWRKVYAFAVAAERAAASPLGAVPLPVAFIACNDHEGEFLSSFPPEDAFNGEGSWATSRFLNENVDAVVHCGYTLVTGFAAATPTPFFSNPLKDLLVFAFLREPHIKATEAFNNGGQDDLSKKIVGNLQRFPQLYEPFPARTEMVAPISFISLPEEHSIQVSTSCKPVICKYISFKLLSSHNTRQQDDANIDVGNLQVHGIPLPEIGEFLEVIE